MNVTDNSSTDVNNQGGGTPPHIGLTSDALPEVQRLFGQRTHVILLAHGYFLCY